MAFSIVAELEAERKQQKGGQGRAAQPGAILGERVERPGVRYEATYCSTPHALQAELLLRSPPPPRPQHEQDNNS